MAIQIINSGASIKIVTNGVARLITKLQIREIVVINTNIIKIDLGLGTLHNIFIPHADVTVPVTPNPEALRDAINDMLTGSINGGATEQKQIEQIVYLEKLTKITSDIDGTVHAINSGLLSDPLIIDEAVPYTIYRGYANPGSATNAAVWAIEKVAIAGEITKSQWADGNQVFDNIWDNRTTLIYR